MAAATALRKIGGDKAVAALVDGADQDDVRVRVQVVRDLGLCHRDQAHAKLLAVANDEGELPIVAAAALEGLGRFAGDDTNKALGAALATRSFNNERLQGALKAIRSLDDATFADQIIELTSAGADELSAKDFEEAFKTLAAVSQRGRRRDAAYDALSKFLDHDRSSLRAPAIEAIGALRDPRARTLLEPFTAEGQSERIREAARKALEAADRETRLAPAEVGVLRRELRDLRDKYGKLEETVDELKSKVGAEEKAETESNGADANDDE
jgi:HEAT repeat protein